MLSRIWVIATFLVLAACGGGGGGSSPSATAPSGLSYAPAPAFVVNRPIAAITPTVSGTVSSYSVSPALPAGLSLNATSGAISGTPTTVAAAAAYTVTAANSVGSTSATVSITVVDTAPVFTYERTQLTLTTGVPITIAPMSTGGSVTQWSVSPSLPAGLALDATNGTISGSPTVTSTSAQYVVSAQNSGGTATFGLTISVDSGVLLQLGHTTTVLAIRQDSDRVLSLDGEGRWILWNASTGASIANGDSNCGTSLCASSLQLAGGAFVILVSGGLEARSAADGRLLHTFDLSTLGAWYKVSDDGSYLYAGSTTELTAWSLTGTRLFTRPGNYWYAKPYAYGTATELRVVSVPGAGSVEKIAVPSGESSMGPAFLGDFHSWFLDGERFLTKVGNTIHVYGLDGQLQDTKVLSTLSDLTGQGEWFWTRDGVTLDIYAVGASASAAASYTLSSSGDKVIPSRLTIGVLANASRALSIVDLAGATPNKIDVTLPLDASETYAARENSGWLVGNYWGVIADAPSSLPSPRYLNPGLARSIVASTNRIAVATAKGAILYFDAATREQEGQIDFGSSKVLLSSDGTVLAALSDTTSPSTLKIFALPSGAQIQTESYVDSDPEYLVNVSLSRSGQVFGKLLDSRSTASYRREVTPVGGGSVIWSDTVADDPSYPRGASLNIHLGSNGDRIAVASREPHPDTVTNVFVNASLASTIAGWPSGWIDDERLLLNRYVYGRGNIPTYSTTVVVSRTGEVLQSFTGRETSEFQTVDANSIYRARSNDIISLGDGQQLWTSATLSKGEGAVTGSHVVFSTHNSVRIEPY